MTGESNTQGLYAKTLGYYDFIGRPRIINPALTGNTTSRITEIHERMHRELAISTSTGLVVQLLKRTADRVDQQSAAPLLSVAAEILGHSRLAHEALATYTSLQAMVESGSRALVKAHRESLPEYYREALSLCERIAGPVLEPIENPRETHIVLFTTAKYSLSIPCLDFVADLSDLGRLRQTIREHSMDARFQKILEGIERRDLLGRLAERAHQILCNQDDDWRAAGFAVGDLLAQEFPQYEAVMNPKVLEAAAQRFVAVSQAFLERHGVQVEVLVRNCDQQPDPALEEAEIEVTPGEVMMPQDLCLSWQYRDGNSADLESSLRRTHEHFMFFAHLIPLGDDNERARCSLHCYLIPDSRAKISPARYLLESHDPFSITLPLGTLVPLIDAIAVTSSVAFKIDDRFWEAYPNLTSALVACSVHVFVLAHHNTPSSFAGLARREQKRIGPLCGAILGIRDSAARFTIMIAVGGSRKDHLKICSAMSDHGADETCDLMNSGDEFRYYGADKQTAFFDALGVTNDLMRAFNVTTYSDLPARR